MVNGYYIPSKRRIAKTDRVILSMLKQAAFIDDRKIANTHAFSKLEIYAAWFEVQMKMMLQELEKFREG